jgi:hypothetical protein
MHGLDDAAAAHGDAQGFHRGWRYFFRPVLLDLVAVVLRVPDAGFFAAGFARAAGFAAVFARDVTGFAAVFARDTGFAAAFVRDAAGFAAVFFATAATFAPVFFAVVFALAAVLLVAFAGDLRAGALFVGATCYLRIVV